MRCRHTPFPVSSRSSPTSPIVVPPARHFRMFFHSYILATVCSLLPNGFALQVSGKPSIVIAKMDADAHPAPEIFGVQSYPTIVFLRVSSPLFSLLCCEHSSVSLHIQRRASLIVLVTFPFLACDALSGMSDCSMLRLRREIHLCRWRGLSGNCHGLVMFTGKLYS